MKRKEMHGLGLVVVSLALVVALIGTVGYIVFQSDEDLKLSQEQAKEIAESKFNEVKAQTEPVECEELWRDPKAMVGTPSLVRTVDEKPFYWKVPVVLNEKVIGFIDVKMNEKIPRYGCMGCLYSPYYDPHNVDNCPSTVTISTIEEAKEIAKNITDKYRDAVVSEPIYVYDDTGCCSGEAWMLKIEKDGKIISRAFVSGYYAYEKLLSEEETRSVGGLIVAFAQDAEQGEINSTLRKIDFDSINYSWKYIDWMSQKYYVEIPKSRVDDVKFLYNDGFQELNRTLYYTEGDVKEKEGIYIIFLEGEASLEEAKEILNKHNVELREIKWVYIRWSPAAISENVAKKWGEYLELENRTLRVYLDYYE
ncbi:MAG: hypothetical protein IBX41_01585 [Methanophagales archaeon]|nr:hypothetical protein [Methanophagales archaeon]